MAENTLLTNVKKALGIQGSYLDETLTQYIDEVVGFLIDSGVKQSYITVGIVSRGVADLWNYGATDGVLSEYFMQRATQLAYKK